MYTYLFGSLIFLFLWLIFYLYRKDLRKDMLFGSLMAMPLAFAEFIFVPLYWQPNVIFEIPFFGSYIDFESFIFSFAVGGIASIIYEVFLSKHLVKAREKRRTTKNHFYTLSITLIVSFAIFYFFFKWALIYSGMISIFIGAIAVMFHRKDLRKEMIDKIFS